MDRLTRGWSLWSVVSLWRRSSVSLSLQTLSLLCVCCSPLLITVAGVNLLSLWAQHQSGRLSSCFCRLDMLQKYRLNIHRYHSECIVWHLWIWTLWCRTRCWRGRTTSSVWSAVSWRWMKPCSSSTLLQTTTLPRVRRSGSAPLESCWKAPRSASPKSLSFSAKSPSSLAWLDWQTTSFR